MRQPCIPFRKHSCCVVLKRLGRCSMFARLLCSGCRTGLCRTIEQQQQHISASASAAAVKGGWQQSFASRSTGSTNIKMPHIEPQLNAKDKALVRIFMASCFHKWELLEGAAGGYTSLYLHLGGSSPLSLCYKVSELASEHCYNSTLCLTAKIKCCLLRLHSP